MSLVQSRFIPKGANAIRLKGVEAVAYASTAADGRVTLCCYAGRAKRPTKHILFRNVERAHSWLDGWRRSLQSMEQLKAERRAQRAAFKHDFKVGEILYTMWGYEQTNVDFYEVTRVVTAASIEIRQVAADREYTSAMTGYATPIAGRYIGEAMTKRVQAGGQASGRVRIASYASATRWDGQPMSWTAYA